ncbi:hypothetical protein ACVW0P_000177 [Mucilaginibacter sp. UYNi724]
MKKTGYALLLLLAVASAANGQTAVNDSVQKKYKSG